MSSDFWFEAEGRPSGVAPVGLRRIPLRRAQGAFGVMGDRPTLARGPR